MAERGRPSKFKAEFCDLIIEVGTQGGWLSEMAEACDVHRSTMDEWAKNYPEFSEALSRAKQKAQAWFERTGREGMTADKFNSSLWAKQMSSRHPDEYTERQKQEHTGADGGPIQVQRYEVEFVGPARPLEGSVSAFTREAAG